MPEMFYQQLRCQKRYETFSVVELVLVLCMLPLSLIAFRRYPLLAAVLLTVCAVVVLVRCRRRRLPTDAPVLYSVLYARVLILECTVFDAQRFNRSKRQANHEIDQKYHIAQEISIADSYVQFRLNLVFAARDDAALHNWVSAQLECLLQRAEPIVQAAIAREQGVLLFPALHQWVTLAEAHVYETAARLLTELFLEE